MKINIITPCTRPENLMEISKSIKIPKKNYRWIVVFDLDYVDPSLIPDNCEYHYHRNPNSQVGNGQRNYVLDFIKDGYIYFLDDDTIMSPYLWDKVKDLDNDLITFGQLYKNGDLRVDGKTVRRDYIDTGCALISRKLIGDSRWIENLYQGDGVFLTECHLKSKTYKYLPYALSIYNALRNE